jgi:predicted nucleic-acid-binding Zn-ribbon protein
MREAPEFNFTCSHCGATETYTLVPANRASAEPSRGDKPVPEFDFTCSKCGTSETFQLVRMTATV